MLFDETEHTRRHVPVNTRNGWCVSSYNKFTSSLYSPSSVPCSCAAICHNSHLKEIIVILIGKQRKHFWINELLLSVKLHSVLFWLDRRVKSWKNKKAMTQKENFWFELCKWPQTTTCKLPVFGKKEGERVQSEQPAKLMPLVRRNLIAGLARSWARLSQERGGGGFGRGTAGTFAPGVKQIP